MLDMMDSDESLNDRADNSSSSEPNQLNNNLA